jgi:hypothetical protein
MDLAEKGNVTIEYTDLINMTSSNLNNTVDILYDLFQSSTLAGFEVSKLDE